MSFRPQRATKERRHLIGAPSWPRAHYTHASAISGRCRVTGQRWALFHPLPGRRRPVVFVEGGVDAGGFVLGLCEAQCGGEHMG